jgi:hypothetical protein
MAKIFRGKKKKKTLVGDCKPPTPIKIINI